MLWMFLPLKHNKTFSHKIQESPRHITIQIPTLTPPKTPKMFMISLNVSPKHYCHIYLLSFEAHGIVEKHNSKGKTNNNVRHSSHTILLLFLNFHLRFL